MKPVAGNCATCKNKGAVQCKGCKGTGRNKNNGNIMERYKCYDCQARLPCGLPPLRASPQLFQCVRELLVTRLLIDVALTAPPSPVPFAGVVYRRVLGLWLARRAAEAAGGSPLSRLESAEEGGAAVGSCPVVLQR